jgi:hypothetical protein
MISEPVYTLRHLIYQKYGEQKFALGCELISRWVKFELRGLDKKLISKWTPEKVNHLCNATKLNSDLVYEEAEALRQIFGLSSINQLYTQPF